eukprot:9041087-Heterocapsa_arctica.AAC.1
MWARGQLSLYGPTRFSTPCTCGCCDASSAKCVSAAAVMILTTPSVPPSAPPPLASSLPAGGSCCFQASCDATPKQLVHCSRQ